MTTKLGITVIRADPQAAGNRLIVVEIATTHAGTVQEWAGDESAIANRLSRLETTAWIACVDRETSPGREAWFARMEETLGTILGTAMERAGDDGFVPEARHWEETCTAIERWLPTAAEIGAGMDTWWRWSRGKGHRVEIGKETGEETEEAIGRGTTDVATRDAQGWVECWMTHENAEIALRTNGDWIGDPPITPSGKAAHLWMVGIEKPVTEQQRIALEEELRGLRKQLNECVAQGRTPRESLIRVAMALEAWSNASPYASDSRWTASTSARRHPGPTRRRGRTSGTIGAYLAAGVIAISAAILTVQDGGSQWSWAQESLPKKTTCTTHEAGAPAKGAPGWPMTGTTHPLQPATIETEIWDEPARGYLSHPDRPDRPDHPEDPPDRNAGIISCADTHTESEIR